LYIFGKRVSKSQGIFVFIITDIEKNNRGGVVK